MPPRPSTPSMRYLSSRTAPGRKAPSITYERSGAFHASQGALLARGRRCVKRVGFDLRASRRSAQPDHALHTRKRGDAIHRELFAESAIRAAAPARLHDGTVARLAIAVREVPQARLGAVNYRASGTRVTAG